MHRLRCVGPGCLIALGLLFSSSPAFALSQFGYPPPGSPTWGGNIGAVGSAGGLDWSFAAWNSAEFVDLFVGAGYHGAGLDGTAYDLSFAGIAGDAISYAGTTPWVSPGGSVAAGPYVVDVVLTVTVSGGYNSWLPAASVPGLTALDPDIDAVVDITGGLDFNLNFYAEANLPGIGWVPLNDVQQPLPGGALTQTSVGTNWYGTVPEPTTAMLIGIGLLGMAGAGRRER